MSTEAYKIIEKIQYVTHLNQKEIAKVAGISESYISQIVKGKRELTRDIKARLASSFPNAMIDTTDGIPFYDVDFCLGYDTVFNDQSKIPDGMIKHPFSGRAQCWVSTRGNSMYPLIDGGDMIAIREIPLDGVLFGDVYAIVTEHNRTIKRIRKGSTIDKWRLVPENIKDYDEQEISISEIIKVYKVEAIAKRL